MKTVFIPAKIKLEVNKSRILKISKKLPEKIVIAYSIQYQDQAKEIKRLLQSTHKITKFAQILGCSKIKPPQSTKAILLISSGKFHAISLALETKLPVFILEQDSFYEVSRKDIEFFEKKQKASYLKFLKSNTIGLLVSIKPGQQNLKKALDFKKTLKNKKPYLFLENTFDVNQFENFGLDSWVNTACPRLDINDNSIINMSSLNLEQIF